MTPPDPVLAGSYDNRLVVLSVAIAILAAWTALDLAGRVTAARRRVWLGWLGGGAAAVGIGTWSMHFVGMLAFNLPVPVEYDWPTALLSLLIVCVCSAVALAVLRLIRWKMGWLTVSASGIFLGCGIPALHYTAMTSMRAPAMCHYSPTLVILSVLIAIGFSIASLWLMFLLRDHRGNRRVRRVASALLLSAAIWVMHYTGMSAVSYTRMAGVPDLSHSVRVSWLGIAGISGVPAMALVIALLTSLTDRLKKQKALLDELFEQAPHAVALMDLKLHIVRVNREFTQVFGYRPEEAAGRYLSDLIVPEESLVEVRGYIDSVARGERVHREGVRHCKDGSSVHVAIIHLPVALPGGRTLVYAIYRDITDQKQAEERLRATSEELRALSIRLQSAREEERTRIAREIHDELGSALTGLKWDLEELEKVLADPIAPYPNGGSAGKLRGMLGLIDRTIHTVRRIAAELRPSLLDDLGLVEAIEWEMQQFQARTGIICHCDCRIEEIPLNADQSTAAFRILQEALTNVLRHARATRVSVIMKEEGGEFVLTINDNGRGIKEHEKSGRLSLGILGIEERAHLVGGKVEIAGREGAGTSVIIRFPISNSVPAGGRSKTP
jgi:PAS domain S-box-containing protein